MAQITAKQAAEALFAAIQANDQAQIEKVVEVIKDPQNQLVMEEVQAELKKLQDGSTPKQAQHPQPQQPKQPQQQPQQTQQQPQQPQQPQQQPMKRTTQVSAEFPDIFNAKGLTGFFRVTFLTLLVIVCLINLQPYLKFFELMFLQNMPETIISGFFRFQIFGISVLGTMAGISLWAVIQFIQLRKCHNKDDYLIKNLTYAVDLAIGLFVYPPFNNFDFESISFAMFSDIDWKQVLSIVIQLGAIEVMAFLYCHFATNPTEMVGSQR